MRLMLLLVCVFALVGCTNDVRPAPVPTAALGDPQLPATLSLQQVMAEPERWTGRTFTLIAPVATGDDPRVLVSAFTADGTPLGIDDGKRSLWLAQSLPDETRTELAEDVSILKLRGELSPPGAYGSDGRFPYQFTAESAVVLPPERTTVASLAENPRAFDGVVLEVECFILAQTNTILLVDELSEGGVPTTEARQIKLANIPDQQLLSRLQQSGEVRYGPVRILAWWANGTMTPIEITTRGNGE